MKRGRISATPEEMIGNRIRGLGENSSRNRRSKKKKSCLIVWALIQKGGKKHPRLVWTSKMTVGRIRQRLRQLFKKGQHFLDEFERKEKKGLLESFS